MSAPQFRLDRSNTLKGLRWFILPITANALMQSVPVFDRGATNAAVDFFSIPYWVGVAIIGFRRARCITVCDFLFLLVGRAVLIALLWQLHPQTRQWGR